MWCCIFHLFWLANTNAKNRSCHAQHVCCFLHFLFLVACIVPNCKNIQITMERSSSSAGLALSLDWIKQWKRCLERKRDSWKNRICDDETKVEKKRFTTTKNIICNEERLLFMLLFSNNVLLALTMNLATF